MLNIALHQPEIPPNTGNVIRLCANTGFRLHLLHPLGFSLGEKQVRRAGLDYHDFARVEEHESYDEFEKSCNADRLVAFSTKGQSCYSNWQYQPGDTLLFGSETRGLPDDILEKLPASRKLRLPMLKESRSLNLSNTVAIVAYEAWRQCGFEGA